MARLIRPGTARQRSIARKRQRAAVNASLSSSKLACAKYRRSYYRNKPCKNGNHKRGPFTWKSGDRKGDTYYTCRKKK